LDENQLGLNYKTLFIATVYLKFFKKKKPKARINAPQDRDLRTKKMFVFPVFFADSLDIYV